MDGRHGLTGEVLRPRLSYDVRRWATVFPLGMYAACSFATGQVTGITGTADFGHGWTWVAFTASLLVLAGLFRHGWPVLRGQHHPGPRAGRGLNRADSPMPQVVQRVGHCRWESSWQMSPWRSAIPVAGGDSGGHA